MRKKIIRATKLSLHKSLLISQGLLVLKNNWHYLIKLLVELTFRRDGNPVVSIFTWQETRFFCMRNEFLRNLVLGALESKKLSKLQKKLSFAIIGISIIFFVIKFYVKTCLVIIIVFWFSSNKKLEKKMEQEKSLLKKVLGLVHLLGYLWKKCPEHSVSNWNYWL